MEKAAQCCAASSISRGGDTANRESSALLAAVGANATVPQVQVTRLTVAATPTFADIIVVGDSDLKRLPLRRPCGLLGRRRDGSKGSELQFVEFDPPRTIAIVVLQDSLPEGNSDLGLVVGISSASVAHHRVTDTQLSHAPSILVLDTVNGRPTPWHSTSHPLG